MTRPPVGYREACLKLDPHAADGTSLKRLAAFDLDESKLQILAKTARRVRAAHGAVPGLTRMTLGLLSNATTDLLAPAIVASALRYGLDLDIVTGPFGQVLQAALDPASAINQVACDAVLVALDHRGLDLAGPASSGAPAAVDLLAEIRQALARHQRCPAIFQTVPAPPERLFGSFDSLVDDSVASTVIDINRGIRTLVRQSAGDLLFDAEALAASVGLDRWHDPAHWNIAKLPFAQALVPLYAEHLSRLLGAMRGKSRKCLALDLDNTIWGGVVGDDGVNGLVIGNGSALGEAFLDVQRTALALRQRGVILAACSKNDDEVARRPFRERSDMLLREEHFAVFQANWSDKATNIEAIARQLNIGTDSIVLLDDNPAERDQVRSALPEVAVPELPEDVARYGRQLLQAGYFEAVSFSAEDRDRAAHYAANARRVALARTTRDLRSYLDSLEMTAAIGRFSSDVRARVTQLINKSNQFNLTTRRYTEAEIADIESDPSVFTVQARLVDRFGDNGIVSVVICRDRQDACWEIDSWLMSCRVLGRRLEHAILNHLAASAASRGVLRLVGRYIPSGRNELVQNHYRDLGFSLAERSEAGASEWRLDLAAYTPLDAPIHVSLL